MALWIRLIVLILLAAVPVFLIQIAHEFELRSIRQTRVIGNADTLAGLIAARQDRLIEGARFLLIAASHLQAVRDKDAEACNRVLREIAGRAPELTAIAVLSPDGERWCVSLPQGGPLNLADREYFQATLRTGEMQSSDYIIGRQTGLGSITFTYPVRGQTGGIESILFLAYRTSVFSRTLNEPPLPEGVTVMLVDRTGTVAAAWPGPDQWVGRDLSAVDVVRRAVNERRGFVRSFADWAGPGEHAFAFTPMQPPAHLTVLVSLPLTAALRETESIFWQNVGLTTLTFLLTALAAIVGTHLLVGRPLRELQRSVDAMSRGDFQAGRPVLVRGSKELRSLADHFQEMAQALERRQTQLSEALQQKELLLKEVNHRVKNSLQLVASLFGLQRTHIKDPEARRQFDEAGRRINSVAQVHQRLYQDENVDRVDLDRFLQALCRDLGSAMDGNDKIGLVCNSSRCHLPTEQVIPVALIVNELITNAFKYSYPSGGSGVINVECHVEDDALVISVSDDGAPLPDSFDPAKSEGLGMKIISALARQLRATLEVVRHPKGKSLILRMPNQGAMT